MEQKKQNITERELIIAAYDVVSDIVSSMDELHDIDLVAGLNFDQWNLSPVTIHGDIGPFIIMPMSKSARVKAMHLICTDSWRESPNYLGNILLDPKSGRKTDAFINAWKKQVIKAYENATPADLRITSEDEDLAGPPRIVIEPALLYVKAYNLKDLSTQEFSNIPKWRADETCDERCLFNIRGAEQAWSEALWNLYDCLVHIRRQMDVTYVGEEYAQMFEPYSY